MGERYLVASKGVRYVFDSAIEIQKLPVVEHNSRYRFRQREMVGYRGVNAIDIREVMAGMKCIGEESWIKPRAMRAR